MALAQDREHVAGEIRLGEGEGDASLVRRAQEGDSTAMAVLYRRYVGRVYAYAFQRLHDRDGAEDGTGE
jgi:DNA-directed RNA polymerase specialized sigma24 family protein